MIMAASHDVHAMGNRDIITYHHIASAIEGTSTIDVTVGSHSESVGIQQVVLLHDKASLTDAGTPQPHVPSANTPEWDMWKNIVDAIFQEKSFHPVE